MPYTEIDFVSASDISYMDGRADTVVISIRNPKSEPARIRDGFRDVLHLEFDNVERPAPGCVLFMEAHATEILAFVEKHEGAASRILVNCGAGESRSAAVAFYLSMKYDYDLEEKRDLGFMLHWVVHILDCTDERRQVAVA
jgi:predicted protein tyrosine phosphatase